MSSPGHRARALRHMAGQVRAIETSARGLPIGQRMLLLLLRGDALSLRCAEHLREMTAPEPDEADRRALELANYKLPSQRRLTPSGHHAAGDIARSLMLQIARAQRGELELTFERGLVAGLPPILAAALLRFNGGCFGPAAAARIEQLSDQSDRPAPDALTAWLVDAGFIANDRLTPRGIERVQAAWRSCNCGWYGS